VITRLFAGTPRADRPLRECLHHWRTTHASLASDLPGLRRYVQYHPVAPEPGAWAVFSALDFDDRASLEAAFGLGPGPGSPELAAANADEAAFLDADAESGGVVAQRSLRRLGPVDPMGWTVLVFDAPPSFEAPGDGRHDRLVALPPPLPWDRHTWTTVDLVAVAADQRPAVDALGGVGGVVTRPHVVVGGRR
jgi:uncharacterized protein (TIGR02118 family)